MAEIAEQSPSLVTARPSRWGELIRKEDWWAIWIGLSLVAVAIALFESGSSIKWIAVAPQKWSHLANAGAQLQAHAVQYAALFLLWAVSLGCGAAALGIKLSRFLPAFLAVYVVAGAIYFLGQWDVATTFLRAVSASTPVALRDRLGDAVLAEPQVGADRAGRDGVDADAARAELLRQRLGEVDQRGLGGAVVDRAAVGLEERVHRGDVDDRARRPASPSATMRRARRAQRGEEVHLHRPLELVVARAEEALEAQPHGADVVHQHVDAAVLVERALHELRRPVRAAQVDRHGGDAARGPRGCRGARAGDDARALVDERARDRQADALAGAGDDRDLAGELEVHVGEVSLARKVGPR